MNKKIYSPEEMKHSVLPFQQLRDGRLTKNTSTVKEIMKNMTEIMPKFAFGDIK